MGEDNKRGKRGSYFSSGGAVTGARGEPRKAGGQGEQGEEPRPRAQPDL